MIKFTDGLEEVAENDHNWKKVSEHKDVCTKCGINRYSFNE